MMKLRTVQAVSKCYQCVNLKRDVATYIGNAVHTISKDESLFTLCFSKML